MSDEWRPTVMVDPEYGVIDKDTGEVMRYALMAVAHSDTPLPKKDETFVVRVRRPRNMKHHRLYWAMIGSVVEATGRWNTKRELHEWLLFTLGFRERVWVDENTWYDRLMSTDFMAMDQDTFNEYFELVVAAICLETGIDPLDLRREVSDQKY